MWSVGFRWSYLRAMVGVVGVGAAGSCSLHDEGAALDPLELPLFTGGVGAGGNGSNAGSLSSDAGGTGGVVDLSGGRETGGETSSGGADPAGGRGGWGAGGTAAGGLARGGAAGRGTNNGGMAGSGVSTGGAPTGGAPTGGAPCSDPEVWCDTAQFVGCAELGTQDHCSGCGLACPMDEECVDSGGVDHFSCSCISGERCPAEDGSCVDTQSDPAHCGECDLACGSNAECTAGACGCTHEDFPDAHEGDCFDFASDEEHCGDFETACLPGEECIAGECICDSPRTLCPEDGDPEVCVDLDADAANCGACGTECAVNGICQEGACVCQPDATLCLASEDDPGVCAHVEDDPGYCGAECVNCAVAVGIGAVCNTGECECPTGFGICIDPSSGGDMCVDRDTDENHCGRCDNPCAPGGDCVQGVCVETPCQDLCSGAIHMDPAGTVKPVGCYELFATDLPNVTVPRLTGWEFKNNFRLAVNGEAWPQFTQGGDHPLGQTRASGWCIEVLSGSANVYAPDD